MKNQTRAFVYALIAVILWSTAASAFKIALRDLNNIQLLFIANITSLVVFFVILAFSGKLGLLKHMSTKEISISAVQGFLNPFAYYAILFSCYNILPAQVAQPANFIWPIVLMLLSVPLLKQPLKLAGIAGLLISFTGVLILATQGQLKYFKIAQPAGILMALGSSVIWSLYWIINLKDKRDDLIKLFLSFGFSMAYVLILGLCTDNIGTALSKSWIPAIYVGLFEMGVTFVLWLKALQYSESTGRIANLIYLTPFLSLLVIHFVLHEKIYYTSFIGLCLIVAGIMAGQIKSRN